MWAGGAPNLVDFEDIPLEAKLQLGDTVVTDARSAIFPAGWPIGMVVDVRTDSSTFTQRATLRIWGGVSRQQAAYIVKNILAEEQRTLLEP